MATQVLTGETFEETVAGNDIVLVDFWAAWCGPCRMFAPVFEAASEQHTDIVFAKVDTDAEQELSAAADIRSIPTLWAFREGVLVFAQPGALPAASLEQVIAAVRGLDMAEVHRQVAEQRAAHEHTHHEHADHEHADHEHADHELADQAPAAEQRATGT